MRTPLIISAAVNGGELTRADTPFVPLTPAEISESAIAASHAGASIAHVHVRSEDGSPSGEVSLYREVMERVRAECDVVLNFSTDLRIASGADCLELGPELASLPVGSVNLGDEMIAAPAPLVRNVAQRMRAQCVTPELEIFHEGMIAAARRLVSEQVIREPVVCQFCLGFDGGAPADPDVLLRMVRAIPQTWTWSAVGLGDEGHVIAALAITLGGHVRVGIEDHPYYFPGELAVSNAQLVERVVRLAAEFGRPVATPDDVRTNLQLSAARQPELD